MNGSNYSPLSITASFAIVTFKFCPSKRWDIDFGWQLDFGYSFITCFGQLEVNGSDATTGLERTFTVGLGLCLPAIAVRRAVPGEG